MRKSMKTRNSETRPICRVLTENMSFRKGIAFFILILAVSLPAAAYGQSQAIALLDQYAAGQAAFTKIKTRCDVSMEHDTKMSGRYAVHNGISRTYTSGVMLSDGKRFSHRMWRWGEMKGRGNVTPREEAFYNSELFDGKRIVYFCDKLGSRGGADPNGSATVITTTDPASVPGVKAQLICQSDDAAMLGYLFGDPERIDTVLRRAGQIQVTREAAPDGKPGCFVLRARTSAGTYAVWLDPARSHNIVRAEVYRQAGDLLAMGVTGKTLPGASVSNTITITRFEKRGELWIPMEAAWTSSNRMDKGEYQNIKSVIKRTEVVISPDFVALGAFVPDDVRDGALIFKDGQMYDRSGARLVWRKGEVVPEVVPTTDRRRKSH
jgi:hypothetical protein